MAMKSSASYRWKEKRDKRAFLATEDGSIFRGYSFGADKDSVGEVVFNTGLSGYQEIISDPSYAGQFVTMTYPHIGNYGTNPDDMESASLFLNGLIVHDISEPSNFRSSQSLQACLKKFKVPAIAGLDTRALTSKIRTAGSMKAFMCVTGNIPENDSVKMAKSWEGLDNQDYASRVSCSKPYTWDKEGAISATILPPGEEAHKILFKVVAYDFGIKWNILRAMRNRGMDVTVVPAQTPSEEVLKMKPHGVFLSNGPADPAAVKYAIQAASELIGKVPVMGICLGHQILAIASGARTYRLKFGHHGCNHPVMRLSDKAVEITSQNHNFAVDPESIQSPIELTHINLNDNTVEGIRHKSEPMFAVQYHPEAGPGPHDPSYLFDQFKSLMES